MAERQVVSQVESLQAENKAHIEARNFEADRCRKFEAFLKADAEELAQRVSQGSPKEQCLSQSFLKEAVNEKWDWVFLWYRVL